MLVAFLIGTPGLQLIPRARAQRQPAVRKRVRIRLQVDRQRDECGRGCHDALTPTVSWGSSEIRCMVTAALPEFLTFESIGGRPGPVGAGRFRERVGPVDVLASNGHRTAGVDEDFSDAGEQLATYINRLIDNQLSDDEAENGRSEEQGAGGSQQDQYA